MSSKTDNVVVAMPNSSLEEQDYLTVSLKTLAERLDASRSSVRRWLQEAGIQPISMSNGAKGAIRYHWHEVQAWLQSRTPVH